MASMEAAGQLAWIWGTAFVFGNLFALLWAAVAVLHVHPEYSYKLKRCRQSVRVHIRAWRRQRHHNSNSDGSISWEAANPRAPASHAAAAVATDYNPPRSEAGCEQQQLEGCNASREQSPCSARHAAAEAIILVADDTRPGHLAWKGLGLIAGTKKVLQGVYGLAEPGQLHAVLGPSGCGKSVLLEMLAMRLGQQDRQPSHAAGTTAKAGQGLEAPRRRVRAFPSGSGSRVCGHVVVNGQVVSREEYLDVSAYMPESDTLVPVMTAYEMVSFHTSVTLPHLAPPAQRARAEAVLDMLGLEQQQDTLVGGVLPGGMTVRGLSGGERKRCGIACAVVSLPRILLLDGPLSGLDSFAALSVIRYLESIAQQQHAAVVFTLHQPRAAVWSQIDQVTLLASGRMLYTGATDELAPWLQSLGFSYDPETHGIVPDWALDLVSLGFSSVGTGSSISSGAKGNSMQQQQTPPGLIGAIKRADPMSSSNSGRIGVSLPAAADAFLSCLKAQQPELFHATSYSKSAVTSTGEPKGSSKDCTYNNYWQVPASGGAHAVTPAGAAGEFDSADEIQPVADQIQPVSATCSRVSATGFRKYKALLWREALLTTRNPSNIAGRMLVFTYVSVFFGLVFYNMEPGANSILVRMSVIHMELIFLLLINIITLPFFWDDKRYFLQDVSKGLYHPLQYFISRSTVTVPFGVIMATTFHLIFYGMAGMRHGATYMLESGVIAVLVSLTGQQIVNICATAASSQDLASALVCGWMAMSTFVTPFHNRFDAYTLGWGMSWLRFLSPINWAWQGSLTVELEGRYFDCSAGSGLPALGIMPQLLPDSSFILRLLRKQVDNLGPGCIASGDAVIQMYTQQLPYRAVVGILIGYYTLAVLAAYLVAVWKSRKAAAA